MREATADGGIALGRLDGDGFVLALPGDAFETVGDAQAVRVPTEVVPAMDHAVFVGDGVSVDSHGVGRLDAPGELSLRYDPASTPDPMLLALAYFDGRGWTYLSAETVDTAAAVVTFSVYHFSAYYPARFSSELEAAKAFARQMAAKKVLGEAGGDHEIASRALAGLLADKLGLGEDAFANKMFADIAADQDVVKVFDEYQRDGWTDTGYAFVMDYLCGKVADRLAEAQDDPSALGADETALGNMFDVLKVGNAGSKVLGLLSEGDTNAAARELFDVATDYTGAPGKAVKYALQGMSNALDVWRDGEVENAFRVYTEGSTGTLFGYGAVDAGNFDEVWDGMKGAARQLVIERLATENQARSVAGMPPLTPREEDFYRDTVKRELKAEFDRRIALDARIDAQQQNLELIFDELDAAKLFDGTNVWIRSLNDPTETLGSRLNRFNHLIERIMNDLDVGTVYGGPQHEGPLGGRISAAAMGEMVRGYFAADTQDEGEAFLQDYYRTRFATDSLDGHWVGTLVIEDIDCPYAYGCGGMGKVYQITFDLRTDASGAVFQTGSSVDGVALPADPSTSWKGSTLTTTLLPDVGAGRVLTGTAQRDPSGAVTALTGTWVQVSTLVDSFADPPVAKTTTYRGSWRATRSG